MKCQNYPTSNAKTAYHSAVFFLSPAIPKVRRCRLLRRLSLTAGRCRRPSLFPAASSSCESISAAGDKWPWFLRRLRSACGRPPPLPHQSAPSPSTTSPSHRCSSGAATRSSAAAASGEGPRPARRRLPLRANLRLTPGSRKSGRSSWCTCTPPRRT